VIYNINLSLLVKNPKCFLFRSLLPFHSCRLSFDACRLPKRYDAGDIDDDASERTLADTDDADDGATLAVRCRGEA
jgi:hypothetical protein